MHPTRIKFLYFAVDDYEASLYVLRSTVSSLLNLKCLKSLDICLFTPLVNEIYSEIFTDTLRLVAVDHIHARRLQTRERRNLLQTAQVKITPCVLWVCICIWRGENGFIWCEIESVLQCYRALGGGSGLSVLDRQTRSAKWPTQIQIMRKLLKCRLENLFLNMSLVRTMIMAS
jgi:hypothetical protein